jgi:hypothetical protein
MRREGNISGTLEVFIRQYGSPNSLFGDNAKSQIGKAACAPSTIFNVTHIIILSI